jgi:hypothetical protein
MQAVDWHHHTQDAQLDWPDVDALPAEHSTTLFTEAAQNVIQHRQPDRPFFLHLSYTAVHDPLQAPEDTYTCVPYACAGRGCGRAFTVGFVAVDMRARVWAWGGGLWLGCGWCG